MNNLICPWDQFKPGHLNFCEAKLCAWIVKPSETWSNLSYVLIGIFILALTRKESRTHLASIGYVTIILGLFSGFYHASGTFIGEWLDISSMILFTATGIVFNLKRMLSLPRIKMIQLYFLLTLTSMALIYYFEYLGVVLFGVQFISGVLMELSIYKKAQIKADYTYFKAMVVTFLVAWAVWWLDITKILCNPDNHIFTGHAFWHIATSFTFYFIYRFYCQFKELEN